MVQGRGQTTVSDDVPQQRSNAEGAFLPGMLGGLERVLADQLRKAPLKLNRYGFDPYGFQPDSARRLLLPAALLHQHYFRVETFGIDKVPSGPVLLIANHSGQFAYDGMMLAMSMLLQGLPPRLCRGMGEYFLFKLPWVGSSAARMGQMVGTPENCAAMLDDGECVMVFPEGARGANKPFRDRYQLQRFGTGFMRLALQTRTPIVPVGIVGAEEQQPGFANFSDFGQRLGLPSLPITISMPWLGLAGPLFALPTKYRIHFGEPLVFDGDSNEEDAEIDARVDQVKTGIAGLLEHGLAQREGIFR